MNTVLYLFYHHHLDFVRTLYINVLVLYAKNPQTNISMCGMIINIMVTRNDTLLCTFIWILNTIRHE